MNVVITGTTRGLGKALKAELERRGHTVRSCSRPQVDVRDYASLARFAETPCDLLIANAAVAIPGTRLWELDPEAFATLLDTNVKGVFHTLRAFLPGMVERRQGVAAVMSSDWGRSASALVSAYCASKWALEGMVRAVSRELPLGVAAVLVDPGNVNTEMLRLALGQDLAARYPSAEEWAVTAAPFFEGLGVEHNGRCLKIPSDLPECRQSGGLFD
jgi:NAD(P)-dependent dehydrogenase (short-subunit alcohol dehydrogenase family)